MINRPKLSPPQFVIHTILLLGGWGIYFFFAYFVLSNVDVEPLYVIIPYVLIFATFLNISYFWSQFQKRINYRKDEELEVFKKIDEKPYREDWIGHAVQMDQLSLKDEKYIRIDMVRHENSKKWVKVYQEGNNGTNN